MNTKDTIERFIVDEIMMGDSQAPIDPDQSLLSSGILDSLALIRLIGFIEGQFGMTVEDGEVIPDNFETMNHISSFLERKMAAD